MTDRAGVAGEDQHHERPPDPRTLPGEWFDNQARSCAQLGSPLYAAVLPHVAQDVRTGRFDDILGPLDQWRFGHAVPLRLLGAAHALALSGEAPGLATAYPSCGGHGDPPPDARGLADELHQAVTSHPAATADYLARAVQTNEPGRASALVLGLSALAEQVASRSTRGALTDAGSPLALVEIGSSAGLNLRLDRFGYVDGARWIGGDPDSLVRLSPDWLGPPPTLHPWRVSERWGLDPHPIDPGEATMALRLRSYLWPDQIDRRARLDAAIDLAHAVPATVLQTDDTAADLATLLTTLAGRKPVLVFHSIVWQYVPVADRTAITQAIEDAGRQATAAAPVIRLSFEPDPLHGGRAAVQLRTWPGGAGRLLAHADFHGRWVESLPDRGRTAESS